MTLLYYLMKNIFIHLIASLSLTATATTLPLSETFDGLSLGSVAGQNDWTLLSGIAQVQTNAVATGTKALEIQDGSVSHALSSGGSSVWVRFQARITVAPSDNPTVINANTSVAFFVNTNRNLVVYSNTTPIELSVQMETNVWTQFDVYCDYTASTWMLSVNSNTVAQQLGLYSASSQLESLLIANDSASSAYVDELTVQDTELSAGLADSDSDGLPDWWELRHFGSITNATPGGLAANGRSYLDAYIAGLDPADETATFSVTRLNARKFGWSRQPSRQYDIYWASNLISGFSMIYANITASEFEDTNTVRTAETSGFYQIRVHK